MVSEAGQYGQPGIGGPNKYEVICCLKTNVEMSGYLLDAKHFLSASQVFVIRLIFETPTKYAFHFLSGQVSVCNKYEVSFGMTRNVLKRMLT